jgi:hypothetical protein
VAGAIFTIPAFMMVDIGGQRLWTDLRSHYWEATLILLVGGLIGVFFIILLRRPLCVDAPLPWPESVASYEIVKSGEASETKAPRYIFGALGFGGLIEILTDDKGAQIFHEYVEGFLRFPRSVIQHFDFEKRPIGDVTLLAAFPGPRPACRPRSSVSAISSGRSFRASTYRAALSPGGFSSRCCCSLIPICRGASDRTILPLRRIRSGSTSSAPLLSAPCW